MDARSLRTEVRAVPVWDRFVRLFHWSLVSCVLLNYFVVDDGESLHQWLGYGAVALVAGRVLWGFIGSPHARFRDFMPTPSSVAAHLRDAMHGRVQRHAGHNPLGALMMLALMACVLGLGLSGWLQTTDAFWGESWLQEIHAWLGHALIIMAGVHAAAAIVMSRLERTNLIGAMVTGTKVFR